MVKHFAAKKAHFSGRKAVKQAKAATRKAFLCSVVSVKMTSDMEQRASELVVCARKAKAADFLAKYRKVSGVAVRSCPTA